MVAWKDMTEIERLAHSIKNNTAYQNRYREEVPSLGFGPSSATYRETNPSLFDQARALLAIDSTPVTREDRKAGMMTTTRAEQQQQAQSTPLGMSNAQVASFNSLVESGKFNPDGSVNMDWFNSLSDKEAKEAWYQGINYGYGLGNTATHKAMKDSMRAVYNERFPPKNQRQDFTFGGSGTAPVAPPAATSGMMTEAATDYVGPGGNTAEQWSRNKDFIVEQVEAGQATNEQMSWYNDWISAGQPSTQAEMNAWRTQTPVDMTGNEEQEQAKLNQRFIEFLQNLGLQSLADLFSGVPVGQTGGLAGANAAASTYTPYTPIVDSGVAPVDYGSPLLPVNPVGYDPTRGIYNVPQVMQPGTAAQQAGLFNYIYPPAATPMAPLDPMEGITVPTIDYKSLYGPDTDEQQQNG